MSNAAAWAVLTDRLVNEVATLATPELKRSRMIEVLFGLESRDIVEVLHEVVVRAEARDPSCQELMLSLVNLGRYHEELGYERIADIYILADERGYDEVKRLISTSNAKKRIEAQDYAENEYVEKTLGERKALAMTRDRDLLDRMMFDRNKQVIRKLLHNPLLTERDVIKIASMRPTTPDVVGEVVNSSKWIKRYRIKKTVICNPYTPVNIALSLLGYMLVGDLKEIAENTTLADEVRETAKARAKDGPVPLDA